MFKIKRKLLNFSLIIAIIFISLSSDGAKTWPEKVMVGYIDLNSVGAVAKLEKHLNQLQKYEVIVYGFADKNGNITKQQGASIKSLSSKAKPETIHLLSIGGEHATEIDFSHATIHNLIDTVKKLKLDGIDFDVENILESDKLVNMAKEIKTHDHDLFVTAAPQIAGIVRQKSFVSCHLG